MKKAIQIIYGLLLPLILCFTVKVHAQCDLHNSIDVSGHRLSSHLTLLAYQWVRCPGYIPIPGATAQTMDVSVDGEYALIGTLDTCTDTTECISVTGLGIGNTMVPDGIRIFPNPAKNGRVNISATDIYSDATVQIVDIFGTTKWTSTVHLDQGQAQVHLPLPAGLYFMLIDSKDSYRKRARIVIE